MLLENTKNPFSASYSSLEEVDTDSVSMTNPFSNEGGQYGSGDRENDQLLKTSGSQKRKSKNSKSHYKYASPSNFRCEGSKDDRKSCNSHYKRPRRITVSQAQNDMTVQDVASGCDYVDLLDVTHFTRFHHEGPYDACDSSFKRDHYKSKVKELQKDLTDHQALDPINAFQIQRRAYFKDLDHKSQDLVVQFDAKQRPKVHGLQTLGLGSTTFLEGAPAPVSSYHSK